MHSQRQTHRTATPTIGPESSCEAWVPAETETSTGLRETPSSRPSRADRSGHLLPGERTNAAAADRWWKAQKTADPPPATGSSLHPALDWYCSAASILLPA